MTLEEVCQRYGYAESCFTNAFPRTQKAILKKFGVDLVKIGRGKNAYYEERKHEDLSIETELYNNPIVDKEDLNAHNWYFMVFLAIVTSPHYVFRGSFEECLRHIEADTSAFNVNKLKRQLVTLENRNLIIYELDRTNKDYFIAALTRQTELDLSIGKDMIIECQKLAKENGLRDWTPLLKTWLGIWILIKEKTYTLDRLRLITGLSHRYVILSKRILEKNQKFKESFILK